MEEVPSKYLRKAIEEMASLPSVGKKTAARLVLQMLRWPPEQLENFAQSFLELKNHIKSCKVCHNYADEDFCAICKNPARSEKIICVVEDIRDQLAIESTGCFKGQYHILNGLIAPIEGIGPKDIYIDSLVKRVENQEVEELIFALSSSIEGEATCYYIYKKLEGTNIKLTTLARGISFGHELEYTDAITLGRSITQRMLFTDNLNAS